MGNRLRGSIVAQLRILLANREKDQRSDSELLNQFISTRDEGAFTILVARHGNMVWETCREFLENMADAEDAFQVTFMRLAQQAATIIKQKSLRAWLLSTARSQCWMIGRTLKRRKRLLENASVSPRLDDNTQDMEQSEIAALLREEVAALPESLRVPLVQRYLEDKTLTQIAFVLGCSDRAVAKRLVRGEALLRRRLATRGMSDGCVGMGALLGTGSVKAALSPRVLANTIRAAMSAPPVSTGWLASVSAVFGRLLASRLGLSLVVLTALLLGGGVYGMIRSLVAAAPPSEPAAQTANLTHGAVSPHDPRHEDKAPVGEEEGNGPQRVVQDSRPLRRTIPATVQVVDSTGKAITNARIAFLAPRPIRVGGLNYHDDLLTEGTGNSEGSYRLNVPTDFPTDYHGLAMVKVLVCAPGHGLATGFQSLIAQPILPPVALDAEKPVQGRLLDPQGRPAVGVRVAVERVGCVTCMDVSKPDLAELPSPWPRPAITDGDGRFVISGLGRREPIELVIKDDRYGLENVAIGPGQEAPAEIPLKAPRFLLGRLRGADNLKPLAGVRVTSYNAMRGFPPQYRTLSSQVTNAEGRFRLPLGSRVPDLLEFATPAGMSYLPTHQPFPEDIEPAQDVEFTLPAAVLLAGRVTDAATNKPIANVTIRHLPTRQNDPDWRKDMFSSVDCPVATDSDGRFSLAVSRAGGHLLVQAQEDDYRVAVADPGMMLNGISAENTHHAHAIVPIAAAGPDRHPDMKIELQRGISIKGRVVKPDGQPLTGGYLICRRRVWFIMQDLRPVALTPQGTFSLDGCEPGKVENVLVVDSTGQWGAVADLLASVSPTEPVTIRTERCGQASFIFVDDDGYPVPGLEVGLTVTLPEPYPLSSKPVLVERKNARIHGVPPELPRMVTDRQGKVRVPFLVPGASYGLVIEVRQADGSQSEMVTRIFQVLPGQNLAAKILVPKPRFNGAAISP